MQSSGIPKITLSFDNLLDVVTELIESYCTQQLWFTKARKVEIKVNQGKRKMGGVQKNSKHETPSCLPPEDSYVCSLLPIRCAVIHTKYSEEEKLN